jgi:hypothetical protein
MRSGLFILAVVVFLGMVARSAQADLWGTNLLANPDAEAGALVSSATLSSLVTPRRMPADEVWMAVNVPVPKETRTP